jgi:hypothetical protein
VAAHDDDLIGAQALGGDHPAQPDGAVPDDRDRVPGLHARHHRGVVSGIQYVGERQQRRHQPVVLAHRQRVQRPVRQRHPHGLGLRCARAVAVEEPAVHTGGVKPLAAEGAGAVGERERHHDQVARLDGTDVRADVLDDADRLMAHRASGLGALQLGVRPQIAAADAGAGDPHDRVGRIDDGNVGHVLDANVAGGIHEGGSHGLALLWVVSKAPLHGGPSRHNSTFSLLN